MPALPHAIAGSSLYRINQSTKPMPRIQKQSIEVEIIAIRQFLV
jgi:hypothetical protein